MATVVVAAGAVPMSALSMFERSVVVFVVCRTAEREVEVGRGVGVACQTVVVARCVIGGS